MPTRVVIAGGGTAGITVAARLLRGRHPPEVLVVEPSPQHYYQPLWTLVGAGVVDAALTARPEARVMPRGARWVQSAVTAFDPEGQRVQAGDAWLPYDFLVVALGIELQWARIAGLPAALGSDHVCSNYSYATAPYTWQSLQEFGGGRALFTSPHSTIKCGGAPQKIMYLAADHWRRRGILAQSQVDFYSGGSSLFAIEAYRSVLERVVQRYGIATHFRSDLTAVRPTTQEAVFRQLDSGTEETVRFDLLHVTPPQGPPPVLRESALADAHGWTDIDPATLQHVRYPTVFGLGDASSLPTSKTGAAVRKQAPVLVKNLRAVAAGRSPRATYHGYTSCPIVTAYGKVMLAEFDYDHRRVETFPFDQARESRAMYLVKRYGLPFLYWHGMLKGRV